MPNIEIWGIEDKHMSQLIAREVWKLIEEKAPELLDEAVVDEKFSRCRDCKASHKPYYRICSTDPKHAEILKKVLPTKITKYSKGQIIVLDIEIMPVAEFIETK